MMKYSLVVSTNEPDYEIIAKAMKTIASEAGLSPSDGNLIIVEAGESTPQDSICYMDALLQNTGAQELVIFSGSDLLRELAIASSCKRNGSILTYATAISVGNNGIEVDRQVYSGHLTSHCKVEKMPCFITLEKSYYYSRFNPEAPDIEMGGSDIHIGAISDEDPEFVSRDMEAAPVQAASGLSDSDFVIALGRGVRGKSNCEEIEEYAGKLGAAVGGTRPVVMNAWLPMPSLIGVSGAFIFPKVCLVLGASGSPAFYSGIEGSGKIIAIDADPDAPITKRSHVHGTCDLMQFIRELNQLL